MANIYEDNLRIDFGNGVYSDTSTEDDIFLGQIVAKSNTNMTHKIKKAELNAQQIAWMRSSVEGKIKEAIKQGEYSVLIEIPENYNKEDIIYFLNQAGYQTQQRTKNQIIIFWDKEPAIKRINVTLRLWLFNKENAVDIAPLTYTEAIQIDETLQGVLVDEYFVGKYFGQYMYENEQGQCYQYDHALTMSYGLIPIGNILVEDTTLTAVFNYA